MNIKNLKKIKWKYIILALILTTIALVESSVKTKKSSFGSGAKTTTITKKIITPLSEQSKPKPITGIQFVYDKADILNAREHRTIQAIANDLYRNYNVAVYTLIVDSMPVKDDKKIDDYVFKYTKDFSDNQSVSTDTVLLFICTEKGNRWREALAFGPIHKKLTSSRLKGIQNEITPNLTASNYHTSIATYYQMVEEYTKAGVPINYLKYIIILLVSIGLGLWLVWYLIKTSKGTVTVCHNTYSGNTARIISENDRYSHTTTVRRKIQTSSSGGGGGGSSRGGGGRF